MPKRVAVVAVHGVSYHPEAQTARDVAGLLERRRESNGSVVFSPFVEETIHIPVNPIDPALLNASKDDTTDVAFSRSRVDGYKPSGPDKVYKTVRLKGGKGTGGARVDVDVYEMYWNDLSKVGAGPLSALSSLYLILFHLVDIGQKSVERAAFAPKSLTCIKVANGLLTVVVPLLNLILLLLLLGMVPLTKDGELARWLLVVAPAVGLLWLGYTLAARGRSRRATLWLGLATLLLSVGGGLTLYLSLPQGGGALNLIGGTIVGGGIVAGGVFLLSKAVEHHRPFMNWGKRIAVVVALIATVALVVGSRISSGALHDKLATGFCTATSIVLLLLAVAWVGFLVVGGIATVGTVVGAKGRPVAQRIAQTVAITLWTPATLFLYLTLSLWIGFASVAKSLFGTLCVYPNTVTTLAAKVFQLPGGALQGVDSFISETIYSLASNCYTLGLGVLALAMLPLLWAFGPSGWQEAVPAQPSAAEREKASHGLGEWVSGGYKLLTLSGVLLGVAFVGFVVGVTVKLCYNLTGLPLSSWPFGALSIAGKEFGGGAYATGGIAGLAALSLWISRISVGFAKFGMVTGVVLDVENHLRELPKDRTPRARMFTRYASLLRYLENEGYNEVVIVAHSQGTVLTADLLRLLGASSLTTVEPSLSRLLDGGKLTLMTLGSPLRQLYALRFPDLYGWVEAWPLPSELGLKRWINLYRSGDYVGRGIWKSNDRNQWRVDRPTIATRSLWEECIGTGAHTHYFDATADETVGATLEALVTGRAS